MPGRPRRFSVDGVRVPEVQSPPLPPLLKRLSQRDYSGPERLMLNLAVVLVVVVGFGFLMPRNHPQLTGSHFALVNWAHMGLGSLVFLVRRWVRWPALVLETAITLVAAALRLPEVSFIYLVCCLYGVVVASSQLTGLITAAAEVMLVATAAIIGGGTERNPIAAVVIGAVSLLLIGWLAGENVRAGRIWIRYRADRDAMAAAAAEAERAERTRRTIAEERAVIARELHDIVAHSMSVVAVRSGVARMVSEARPEEAAEALAIIETTARQSLAEMRRMVSILRGSAEAEADLGPLPGLDDLDQLILQLAAAGVDVELTVEGARRPLAPAADLTAYRIVQEALTNVVRHAGPTRAGVRLAFGPDQLEIDVINSASRSAPARLEGAESGHGLVGMRERAAMFGGTLEAGPNAEGFRVHTTLRIDGPATERGPVPAHAHV